MIANLAAADIRPGLHGPAAARASRPPILARDDDGRASSATAAVEVVEEPTSRASSPCGPAGRRCSAATCTTTTRYRQCFAGGWYLTGDLARRDADGYFWFVGRADDVIKSAGHLIGPFEVESVLMEHPAVVEAGVIGMPDPVAGEVVKAFVACAPGSRRASELRHELHRLRPHAARRRRWRRGDRLRPDAAQDPQRQDHAPPAQGPRARAARGRPATLEARER